jgi:hypothetical protein
MEITSRRCFIFFGFLLVRYLIYLKQFFVNYLLKRLSIEHGFSQMSLGLGCNAQVSSILAGFFEFNKSFVASTW